MSSWREALLGEKAMPQKARLPSDRGSGASGWLTTLGVLLLAGAGIWWGWQQYPQWFGQGDDVARLLAAADANLQARRPTSPADSNVWDMYRRVLELRPANPQAMAGMGRVITSYMELFDEAMEQDAFDEAADYLSRINELHPDSPMLERGQQRLAVAKQVQADRLAEMQRQAEEAVRLAEQERQLQVEEAVRLADQERRRQAELERKLAGCKFTSQEFFKRTTAQEVVDCARHGRGEISGRDKEDMTPLHLAALFKPSNQKVIVALLEAGANVSNLNKFGQTPLHYVAWRSSEPNIIADLAEAGADVNIPQ